MITPKRFMLVAGEASGDALAAELVRELRQGICIHNGSATGANPQFFGAGGPKMAEAGVELAFDLTNNSLIGLPGPRDYLKLRRLLNQLVEMARERKPDGIICVDFQLFNARFANAVKNDANSQLGMNQAWSPKIIKYISPQVWASREYRAYKIARDFDLVLSIIPFEKDWYAKKVPSLPVEFVGHPMIDRHGPPPARAPRGSGIAPLVVLLPGSRAGELKRHLPIMTQALQLMRTEIPELRACMVLPNDSIAAMARVLGLPSDTEIHRDELSDTLREADIAISKTGTISMECAYFGVPTVTLYKTSWLTYQIGKRIIKVKSATMPNLLANEMVFPEFVEEIPTAENVSKAALALLKDEARRQQVQTKLKEIIASLGGPGASRRAAAAILKIIP